MSCRIHQDNVENTRSTTSGNRFESVLKAGLLHSTVNVGVDSMDKPGSKANPFRRPPSVPSWGSGPPAAGRRRAPIDPLPPLPPPAPPARTVQDNLDRLRVLSANQEQQLTALKFERIRLKRANEELQEKLLRREDIQDVTDEFQQTNEEEEPEWLQEAVKDLQAANKMVSLTQEEIDLLYTRISDLVGNMAILTAERDAILATLKQSQDEQSVIKKEVVELEQELRESKMATASEELRLQREMERCDDQTILLIRRLQTMEAKQKRLVVQLEETEDREIDAIAREQIACKKQSEELSKRLLDSESERSRLAEDLRLAQLALADAIDNQNEQKKSGENEENPYAKSTEEQSARLQKEYEKWNSRLSVMNANESKEERSARLQKEYEEWKRDLDIRDVKQMERLTKE